MKESEIHSSKGYLDYLIKADAGERVGMQMTNVTTPSPV